MGGPDPAVAALRRAVADDLAVPTRSGGPSQDPLRVLVACSGGPDSLALAATVAFLAAASHRTRGRPMAAGAVIVDHRWHPGSGEVASAAAATCRALGLDPVDVVAVSAAGPGGPEAAARVARYEALDDAARRYAAHVVLLGHTADDQAETVLLGLARGSGLRSIAGMARRTDPGGRGVTEYRRPLLGLRRALTERACRALGLEPWTDPANASPAYARARLRAALATLDEALGPGLVDALARTAESAAEDAAALESMAAVLVTQASCRAPAGPGTGWSVEVLVAAPDAVRRRAVLAVLRAAGCPAGSLTRRHVLAVDALLTDWRGQGPVHLPGGIEATRACGRLALSRPDSGPGMRLTPGRDTPMEGCGPQRHGR